MFQILRNNKILITKGDNAELQITLKDKDGTIVEISDEDTLKLTVKATADSTTAAITKSVNGNTIYLVPSDTNSLSPGLYVYDIQYTNSETSEVSTVIPLSFFEIIAEVSV